MRRLLLLAGLTLGAVAWPASASAAVSLESAGTFTAPIYVTAAPGDSGRLFVVERGGTVRVRDLTSNTTLPASFLDLTAGGVSTEGEGGLLSIAFPPDYAASGLVYALYTPNGDTVRLVEARRDPADPNRTTGAPRTVLEIPHPTNRNHYGGQLQFDRSGRLYLSTGDGGAGGDPPNNAQNLGVLLGKILRIDPRASGARPYSVPADNPFAGQAGRRPEIWSFGLRNAFRFSLDRTSGDMTVGDVGQGDVEEVDFVRRASGAGAKANFGWRRCEGSLAYPVAVPPQRCGFASTLPVLERNHSTGDCSIIGGYVVRDASLQELRGRYVHADFCPGLLFSASLQTPTAQGDAPIIGTGLDLPDFSLVSFGEDACARVYAVQRESGGTPGQVLRLSDGTSSCTAAQALALPPAPPSIAPAAPPGSVAPAAPPGSVAPDLRSPLLGLRTGTKQRPFRNHGVIVRVRCDEPCSYRVGGRLSLKRNGRKIALRERTGSLPANTTARLRLRLSGSSARALKRALRRGSRVRARVEVRVRDRSGNLSKGNRLLRLTR